MNKELCAAQSATVSELIYASQAERASFLHNGAKASTFGLELFRRAICERNNLAWEAIMEQHRGMLLLAIRRHSGAHQADEDEDYWVNCAFQRFWSAIGPERFEQFSGLPAILGYLKMCAISVVIDDQRAQRRARLVRIDDTTSEDVLQPDHAELVADHLAATALWAAILEALTDDTHRLVAQLSFVGELTPRAIFAGHRDRFNSVHDVYNVKRNVIDRLRKKPAIRAFLNGEGP